MEATIMMPVKVNVDRIKINVPVRYDEEQIPNDFPLRKGEVWAATIELETGKIIEWPADKTGKFEMYLKVCDEGKYQIITKDGEPIGADEPAGGYVPHSIVPGEYGDYIDFKIENGIITNWPKEIDFSEFFNQEDA